VKALHFREPAREDKHSSSTHLDDVVQDFKFIVVGKKSSPMPSTHVGLPLMVSPVLRNRKYSEP